MPTNNRRLPNNEKAFDIIMFTRSTKCWSYIHCSLIFVWTSVKKETWLLLNTYTLPTSNKVSHKKWLPALYMYIDNEQRIKFYIFKWNTVIH